MKRELLHSILVLVFALSFCVAVSAASNQFTSVTSSTNPSSSGTAQDLNSSQYIASALGQKYSSESFTSVVDSQLSTSTKQNGQMNTIIFGGPVSNSITKELVNSGKSKVNWATSNGQTEIIPNAWGPNKANAFIVAGKDRDATEKACEEFAAQIKAGTVPFTDTTPPNPVNITYTIQATANTGGSISPSGDVIVNAGDSQTFNIHGQWYGCVYVDGAVVYQSAIPGFDYTYTFTNVQSDHVIIVFIEN